MDGFFEVDVTRGSVGKGGLSEEVTMGAPLFTHFPGRGRGSVGKSNRFGTSHFDVRIADT